MVGQIRKSELGKSEGAYLDGLEIRLSVGSRDFLGELRRVASRRREIIGKIVAKRGEPTYKNTIIPSEEADEEYQGLIGEYRGLMDLVPTRKMRDQEAAIVKLDTDENERELFDLGFAKRVKTLYLRRKKTGRGGVGWKLIRDYYRGFLLGGSYLGDARKKKLAKLERALAGVELAYGRKIDRIPKYVFLSKKSDLDGLGKTEVLEARRVARKLGRSGWAMRLEPTLAQPPAARLQSRRAREAVIRAAGRRGRGLEKCAIEIARLRFRIAKVLGFKSWAHLKFFESEGGNPAKVWCMFRKSLPAVKRLLARDVDRASKCGWRGHKGGTPLWCFFPEKEGDGRFDPVRVLEKGCFWAAKRLFGLEFSRIRDFRAYHEDVRSYIVRKGKRTLGFFLVDFWQRQGKGDGAWAIAWDSRRIRGKFPSVSICCNFVRGAGCNMEGVVTVFHEFGHALHALFTSHLQPSHVGLECSNNFVEIPSQTAEHWAYEKEIYTRYAGRRSPSHRHASSSVEDGTGAVYLASLVSAGADLVWHGEEAGRLRTAQQADRKAVKTLAAGLKEAEPRYKSPHFEHIFNSGYDASYYSYLWCELKAGQIQNWTNRNGGMRRKNGNALLRHVYGVGGDRNPSRREPWVNIAPRLAFEFRGGGG